MKKLLLSYLLVMITTTVLAAQAVVPPPRPQPDGPPIASILESLKQTLLASGEVKYTKGPYLVRLRLSDVVVNAADCQMRVSVIKTFADLPTKEISESYFFEAIDSAEVMTLQEAWNTSTSEKQQFSAGYVTVMNHNDGLLQFRDRDIAVRVAELLRQASAVCRARPVRLNAAAGKPGLPETLHFIEQKLIGEGAVSYQAQSVRDSSSTYYSSNQVLSALADPATCLLRYRIRSTLDGKPAAGDGVISFRRVQKLEVVTDQQISDRAADETSSQLRSMPGEKDYVNFRQQLTPTTYQLQVTYSGGQIAGWAPFRDEDTADRVAKAMNHAAELCRPENKELF